MLTSPRINQVTPRPRRLSTDYSDCRMDEGSENGAKSMVNIGGSTRKEAPSLLVATLFNNVKLLKSLRKLCNPRHCGKEPLNGRGEHLEFSRGNLVRTWLARGCDESTFSASVPSDQQATFGGQRMWFSGAVNYLFTKVLVAGGPLASILKLRSE